MYNKNHSNHHLNWCIYTYIWLINPFGGHHFPCLKNKRPIPDGISMFNLGKMIFWDVALKQPKIRELEPGFLRFLPLENWKRSAFSPLKKLNFAFCMSWELSIGHLQYPKQNLSKPSCLEPGAQRSRNGRRQRTAVHNAKCVSSGWLGGSAGKGIAKSQGHGLMKKEDKEVCQRVSIPCHSLGIEHKIPCPRNYIVFWNWFCCFVSGPKKLCSHVKVDFTPMMWAALTKNESPGVPPKNPTMISTSIEWAIQVCTNGATLRCSVIKSHILLGWPPHLQ